MDQETNCDHNEDICTIINTAENLMEVGAVQETVEYLENAIQQYPEDIHIALLLGEAYLCNGEPQKAIKPLKWALKRKDGECEDIHQELDWELYSLLGCSYARSGKFKKAMEYLDLANNIMPNHAEILRNIGRTLCMQNKTISGRAILRRAIIIDPKNALSYSDLGESYMADKNYEEAKIWISKARELDPFDLDIMETADELNHLMNLNKLFPKHRPRRLPKKNIKIQKTSNTPK